MSECGLDHCAHFGGWIEGDFVGKIQNYLLCTVVSGVLSVPSWACLTRDQRSMFYSPSIGDQLRAGYNRAEIFNLLQIPEDQRARYRSSVVSVARHNDCPQTEANRDSSYSPEEEQVARDLLGRMFALRQSNPQGFQRLTAAILGDNPSPTSVTQLQGIAHRIARTTGTDGQGQKVTGVAVAWERDDAAGAYALPSSVPAPVASSNSGATPAVVGSTTTASAPSQHSEAEQVSAQAGGSLPTPFSATEAVYLEGLRSLQTADVLTQAQHDSLAALSPQVANVRNPEDRAIVLMALASMGGVRDPDQILAIGEFARNPRDPRHLQNPQLRSAVSTLGGVAAQKIREHLAALDRFRPILRARVPGLTAQARARAAQVLAGLATNGRVEQAQAVLGRLQVPERLRAPVLTVVRGGRLPRLSRQDLTALLGALAAQTSSSSPSVASEAPPSTSSSPSDSSATVPAPAAPPTASNCAAPSGDAAPTCDTVGELRRSFYGSDYFQRCRAGTRFARNSGRNAISATQLNASLRSDNETEKQMAQYVKDLRHVACNCTSSSAEQPSNQYGGRFPSGNCGRYRSGSENRAAAAAAAPEAAQTQE